MSLALQDQFQQIIPLITLTPRDNPAAAVYLSNQAVKVNNQAYLPRMLEWSGISQSLSENSDSASFTFGNADGVWQTFVNQVNLYAATIQVTLFHVNSRYLLDLWLGSILNWGFDTGGRFQVNASDGVFNLGLAYPSRKVLRTCWKVYRGRWCPASASNGFPDCPKDYDVLRGARRAAFLRRAGDPSAGRPHHGQFHRGLRLRAQRHDLGDGSAGHGLPAPAARDLHR